MGKEQLQVTLVDSMGSDLSIVNAARVSFGKKSEWEKYYETEEYEEYPKYKLKDQDVRLLKYLAKHKHMSPFGHVFLSFHIKAPIFVRAQLVKHKFLRMNEISRRYVDTDIEFYQPDVWRGRSEDKKQGSSAEGVVGQQLWCDMTNQGNKDQMLLYTGMIKQSVAPEMARMVLPQSLMTEWYWSGSLDAFTDMCRLRIKEDTQYESRVVANAVYQHIKEVFPVSAPLLVEGFVDVN